MSEQLTPTELGTKPIGRLLLSYAVPAIIAMTASSLYNIVDSIVIGQVCGALAISGLAITFPIMNLSAAFGAMVGVGASTMISVKLGQKDYTVAQKILGNTVMLNLILGVVFGALMLIFLDPVLLFFGASNNTIGYARDYMVIILLGNVVTHSYLGLNCILRSAGHPLYSMLCTILTVFLNVVLDVLFVYSFDMGIRGAALATVLAQIVALLVQAKLFWNKNELLRWKHGIFGLERKIIGHILSIGMSPFLMNLCACLVVIVINRGLMEQGGDLSVGAYGIVNRVAFIFVMIVMGVNQGMQPIAGFNFGAGRYDRVMRVLWLTMIGGTVVTTSGFMLGEFFPEEVARMFTADEQLITLSSDAMRIVMVTFPIIGIQMVITNFFQSIGMPKKSIFLSLSRQMLFLVPCLIILPKYFGVDGVWYSMPISDSISVVTAVVLIIIQIRKFKQMKTI